MCMSVCAAVGVAASAMHIEQATTELPKTLHFAIWHFALERTCCPCVVAEYSATLAPHI